jgi:CubicO group peptidase (beta-lactamase class C family)
MPRFTRRAFVQAAALPAFPALAACAHTSADPTLAAQVEALLAPLVAANQFTGALVIERKGQAVYARGFGLAHRAADLPFTPDTPSDGGSLAKTFTAAGVQWLAHEGRLVLDAPASRWVPEFPHATTTLRELLAHSNGLPPYYEWFDAHFKPDEVRTTPALLATVARHQPQPAFAPGTRFEYCNLGYDALALAIERASGQGYEAFVATRFLRPLGMQATFARPARLAEWRGANPRTRGYRWRDGAWQDHDIFDNEAFLGASNLWFSARDLARWGSAWASGRALPAAVAAAGQQRPRINGHASAINGLSWYGDAATRRGWYSGSVNAFHSLVHWDRASGTTFAWLSNGDLPLLSSARLAHDLAALLAGTPAPPRAVMAFQRFDRNTRSQVAGVYRSDSLGRIEVKASATGLTLRRDDGLDYGLFPVSREVFYLPGFDWAITFSGGVTPTTLHAHAPNLDSRAGRLG